MWNKESKTEIIADIWCKRSMNSLCFFPNLWSVKRKLSTGIKCKQHRSITMTFEACAIQCRIVSGKLPQMNSYFSSEFYDRDHIAVHCFPWMHVVDREKGSGSWSPEIAQFGRCFWTSFAQTGNCKAVTVFLRLVNEHLLVVFEQFRSGSMQTVRSCSEDTKTGKVLFCQHSSKWQAPQLWKLRQEWRLT